MHRLQRFLIARVLWLVAVIFNFLISLESESMHICPTVLLDSENGELIVESRCYDVNELSGSLLH